MYFTDTNELHLHRLNFDRRRNRATHDKFPQKFKFGVNTLAYHVEGAWNQDGKGPEVFDTFEQQYPENMTDMSNLDISANHYNLYREDVQNMKKIGVRARCDE